LLESLKADIKTLMEIDHPNIVKYFDIFEDRLYIHISMEFISGDDLYTILTNHKLTKNFTERNAWEIIDCLLKAISVLHSKNIIHKDIKPENILFAITGINNLFT